MPGRPAAAPALAVLAALAAVLGLLAVAAARADLAGYWATPGGALFRLVTGPRGGVAATSASGLLGMEAGVPSLGQRRGWRSVEVAFPSGLARGRLALSGRQIVWDRGPPWVRQGAP